MKENESTGFDWLIFTVFSVIALFLTFVVALLNLTSEDWDRKIFSASLFYDANDSNSFKENFRKVELLESESNIEKVNINSEAEEISSQKEKVEEQKEIKNVKRVVKSQVKTKLFDENLLIEIGFENASVEANGYNGWIFDDVDFNELGEFGQGVENVLFANENVLTVTWFKAENKTVLNEIYGLILLKYNQKIGVSVNETNNFGEKSFYVNFSGKNDKAFLVVKLKGGVYSFAYKKEIHGKVLKLIEFLNK